MTEKTAPPISILLLSLVMVISILTIMPARTNAIDNKTIRNIHHGPYKLEIKPGYCVSVFFTREPSGQIKGFLSNENHNKSQIYPLGDWESETNEYNVNSKILSVFLSNVDSNSDQEIIVLIEQNRRTYYTKTLGEYGSSGGYAGTHPFYKTRVFKHHKHFGRIIEYCAIGDLLTVNYPEITGMVSEESLMFDRENERAHDVLGITYNYTQIQKRIQSLRDIGLLQ